MKNIRRLSKFSLFQKNPSKSKFKIKLQTIFKIDVFINIINKGSPHLYITLNEK